MNFKHLIITRFDYPEDYPYMKERFELFHKFCEPSIKNQINNNFLWIILSGKNNISANKIFVVMNNKKLKEYIEYLKKDFEWIITTRFDCDDFLAPTFTEELHNKIHEKEEIIDFSGYRYDLRNNQFYKDTKYHSKFPSPFISLVEKAENYKGVYFDQHQKMIRYYPLQKIPTEQWIQIIHDNNKVLNKYSQEDLNKQGNSSLIPSYFTSYITK